MTISKILTHDINSNFLYLFILFADFDYTGIADYTVKAIIGGLVWFGFKIVGDYFEVRIKRYGRRKENGEEK